MKVPSLCVGVSRNCFLFLHLIEIIIIRKVLAITCVIVEFLCYDLATAVVDVL